MKMIHAELKTSEVRTRPEELFGKHGKVFAISCKVLAGGASRPVSRSRCYSYAVTSSVAGP